MLVSHLKFPEHVTRWLSALVLQVSAVIHCPCEKTQEIAFPQNPAPWLRYSITPHAQEITSFLHTWSFFPVIYWHAYCTHYLTATAAAFSSGTVWWFFQSPFPDTASECFVYLLCLLLFFFASEKKGIHLPKKALETCPSPVRNPVCHFMTDFLQSSFLDTVLLLSLLLW